jgi:hypothetical protein
LNVYPDIHGGYAGSWQDIVATRRNG